MTEAKQPEEAPTSAEVSAHLGVGALQADGEALEHRVQRQRQEEHEGAKRRVSLEVHVHVVPTALQIGAPHRPVTVLHVTVSVFRQEGGSLVMGPLDLPAVQDDLLQNEDHKEARGHDELRQRKAGLWKSRFQIQFDAVRLY